MVLPPVDVVAPIVVWMLLLLLTAYLLYTTYGFGVVFVPLIVWMALDVWDASQWGKAAAREGHWVREVAVDRWEGEIEHIRWSQKPRDAGPLLTVFCLKGGTSQVFLSGDTRAFNGQALAAVVPDGTKLLSGSPDSEPSTHELTDHDDSHLRLSGADQFFAMLTASSEDSEMWVAPSDMGEGTYEYDTDWAAYQLGGSDCGEALDAALARVS